MMNFEPYKSAGPLKFGMNSDEVRAALGEPKLSNKNRRGETVLRYDGIHVTLSDEGVVEVEFLPETVPSLTGVNILSDRRSLGALCVLDGDPQQCAGYIILLNLGISLTGVQDNNEDQKSVTAFARHRFDILKSQMTKFTDFSA